MVSPTPASDVLGRLDPERRRSIEEFASRVRELFGPRLKDLRLHGSTVRGEQHEESDIDILVLVEAETASDHRALSRLAHEISTWLDPHLFDYERYHAPRSRATGFYKEMRKESVRL